MRLPALLVAAACLARPLAAQSADVRHQILAARDTVWRAWFAHDTTLLHRFLPPAAASVDGAASEWRDRPHIVADSRGFARSGARLVGLAFTNTEIAMTGQSALVRSRYRTIVASGGRTDTTNGRATELFVRQGATWVNPYWQLEPLARGAAAADREVPLPDTLGARFALGDTATMQGTLADYDGLVGTWAFRFQPRAPDGSYYPPFTGHWTFEKKPGGGLVEDRWRPDDPSTPMAQSLYTYRQFDPEHHAWRIVGMSSRGGVPQLGWTWSDSAGLSVIQRNRDVLSRIRYVWVDADHFLWRSDRSADGGKTWQLDEGLMEAWRIGR